MTKVIFGSVLSALSTGAGALTLHNIPEGLSVGVSYASQKGDTGNFIQNAPEGLLVALFLTNQRISKLKAFIIATLTGAIEIVTSLLGYFLTSLFKVLSLMGYLLQLERCCLSFIMN